MNPSTTSNEATNLLPSMLTLGAHVGAYVRKRNAPREVFLVVAIDAETKSAQLRTRFMEDAAQSIVASDHTDTGMERGWRCSGARVDWRGGGVAVAHAWSQVLCARVESGPVRCTAVARARTSSLLYVSAVRGVRMVRLARGLRVVWGRIR